MSVTREQLDSFHRFAASRIQARQNATFDELLAEWRREAEIAETVTDIEEGVKDHAVGEGQPINQAFAQVRIEAGLSE